MERESESRRRRERERTREDRKVGRVLKAAIKIDRAETPERILTFDGARKTFTTRLELREGILRELPRGNI